MVHQNVVFSVNRLWNDRKCTMQIPRSELIHNNHDCIDISAGKELIRGLCCRQEGESSQSPPYIHIIDLEIDIVPISKSINDSNGPD